MNLDDAIAVKNAVRDFYAAGNKSCNKTYVKSSDEVIPVANDESDLYDNLQPSRWVKATTSDRKLQKMATRNQNAPASLADRPDSNGNTYYDDGMAIYNSSQTSGNCAEMAFVAAYLSVHLGKALSSVLLIGFLEAPADHVFCVVGSQPAGRMVSSMTGSAFIIDPWLNTACKASDYFWEAQTRLKKWHRDGKRILWHDGPLGIGWYDPGKSYQDGFLSAAVTYQDAA